jgi:predicted S18 family serine protease
MAGYALQGIDAFARLSLKVAAVVAEFVGPYFEQMQSFLVEHRSYAAVGLVGAAVGVASYMALRNLCCTKQVQTRDLRM